ncbi:MAG TPA: hypothetical protein VLI46_08245 [Ramlibacter sp.]|nr:hypothetical protein [Ramlibacter sp.]
MSLDPQDPSSAAKRFFDDFVGAFSSFNGVVVAQRYAAPYLALRAEGPSEQFSTPDEIARYFQAVLDVYHAQGYRTCRYKDLHVVPLGRRYLLATVTWELLDAADAVVSEWRESYTLSQVDGAFVVSVSMDH